MNELSTLAEIYMNAIYEFRSWREGKCWFLEAVFNTISYSIYSFKMFWLHRWWNIQAVALKKNLRLQTLMIARLIDKRYREHQKQEGMHLAWDEMEQYQIAILDIKELWGKRRAKWRKGIKQ